MSRKFVGRKPRAFILTKEHRRFTEFANAVKKHHYIGLCYGPAGVGKTLSARHYARWDVSEALLTGWGKREPSDSKVYSTLSRSRTVFYTPPVGGTFREFRGAIDLVVTRVEICIEQHFESKNVDSKKYARDSVDLLIIDEAERLSNASIEYIRDWFDRRNVGVIFIGMPGIEKRMSRYPQLYSRVGFAHHYRTLQNDELSFVLSNNWQKLGFTLDSTDFTDNQAINSIARITGGNFRLLNRLFVQIERVLSINELTVITDDVVEAARSTLVIGAN